MCVILVCPANVRPSAKVIEACYEANPHGCGVSYRKDGKVEWLKTNDVRSLTNIVKGLTGEIVIHFRIASVGGVCNELRHPFPVTKNAELDRHGSAKAVLFQNGTWSSWRFEVDDAKRRGHKLPEGEMSDTRAAAFLCSIYGPKILDLMTPSRWVYFTPSELRMIGQWYKVDGMYASNLYWRKDRTPARSETRPSTRPEAPQTPPDEPKGNKTACDLPARRERELWDLSNVGDYWSKLSGKGARPVQKH